jgi:hypothetical protein
MNRIARTFGRRVGHSITSAIQQALPANLSSWKLALYVIVFLVPGGSTVVLAMALFESRRTRKAPEPKREPRERTTLLPCSKHCDV